MKTLFTLLSCFLAMQLLYAQNKIIKSGPDSSGVWRVVEEMPRFPGCEDLPTVEEKKACADKKMLEYIYSDLQYPIEAARNKIEGTCIITFVIYEDGYPDDARVVRSLGYGIDEEALRIITRMQDDNIVWIPGKQNGNPVRVQFNIPLKFINVK